MSFIIRRGRFRAAAVAAITVLYFGQARPAVDTTTVLVSPDGSGGDSRVEGFEVVRPSPSRVPFGEGEYLLFSIQYGLIYAGDATLEVRSHAELGGRRAYHVVSVARTNKAFDMIYKVRDRHESYIDWDELYSLRFEKHLREGRFRRDHEIDFDQSRHVAVYRDEEVGIPPNTHDFLSALYYFRTIDVEPGQAVALVNHTNKKNYPIYIKILRRESVEVPAGRFDCLVAEPVLETSAIFENTGKLTIWFTDDSLRMPVLMRSKVIVGSFEALLKEYRLSEEEHRILECTEESPDDR